MSSKTIYRVYADYAKEEAWLNEMANKGWYLQQFRLGRYRFIKGEPSMYTYRIELLEHMPKHPKSQDYFAFLEEMGIEVVDTSFRWVFLRKRTSDEHFICTLTLIHRFITNIGFYSYTKSFYSSMSSQYS